MNLEERPRKKGRIQVENIGGITETSVDFSPGVTILVGRNATNRTSLLEAVMASLGSDNVRMKGDAEEANVELALGDEMYTRRLSRRSDHIVTEGEPYLDDPELADLFAFLLDSNEARRAVARGDDLRDIIMRPVDTDDIQARIDHLMDERAELKTELDEIDELKGEIPTLEEQRTQLEADIEEKKADLETIEADLEAADADIEETREEKAELEEALDQLQEKRSELDDIRYELETERESLDALKTEQREVEADLDELPETPVGDLDEIDSQIERLRTRKQTLETEIAELQSVIQFNEEMLADTDGDLLARITDVDEGAVTDELLANSEVTCWTCGSEVDQAQIETTIERLQQVSAETVSEVSDIDAKLEDLTDQRNQLQQSQQERDRLERRRTTLKTDIEDTEARIDELQENRDNLTEEISDIEDTVDELEEEDYSSILELHREANQIEYEIGRMERDLERVTEEITEIEDQINQEDEICAQLEAVTDEITDLRTKIDRIEETAVEEFNEHMETVLELLDYDNLDRIWLERVERTVKEGRRNVDKRAFELHVVRPTASGAAYEDTIDHLSESEREVTGLVFALAGYLAHELYEEMPFILLDSLEAIDSDRIATLIDHLKESAGYLLVALLPEDAAALSEEYHRISEI
ncbi:archaea-specific SMC-related protein [Halobacteriaceae archaeon SHR40]|uniref:archaea-specific SMC-related protein n=1 Tax=Halovenus amylolytica TaxID=2500550 RepID=UPI000FE3ACE0